MKESFFQIFGLSNFSIAEKSPNDIKKIEQTALSMLSGQDFSTFRVSARRSIKHFPLKSDDINHQIGASIVEKLGKKVSLKISTLNLP